MENRLGLGLGRQCAFILCLWLASVEIHIIQEIRIFFGAGKAAMRFAAMRFASGQR